MHKVDEVIELARRDADIAEMFAASGGPLAEQQAAIWTALAERNRTYADLLASMKEVLGPLADSPCACGVVVGARCLPCRARNALNGEKP